MNVIRAADVLIEKIKKDYQDDIALLVVMGSYIYGETHSKSDLDMYYVPKTSRGYNLGIAIIVEEVGFDYWPISWERLAKIGNYDERITSIITEGKVIYYSTEEDLELFNQIKQKALDTSDTKKFTQKASDKLNNAYKQYFKLLNSEAIRECRIHALNIIYTLAEVIALLNKTTIKRGRAKLKHEIMSMELIPSGFEELYDTVFITSDINEIKEAYQQLIKETEKIVLEEQEKYSKLVPFIDNLDGFYEELINVYNKIYHACDIQDGVTPLFASVEITNEIEEVFKDTGIKPTVLPDLVNEFDPFNLERIKLAAKNHQDKFVELLSQQGVNIKQFISFEALEDFLNTL